MTESDDVASLFGLGGEVDIPTRQAENVKRTAAPVERLSEAAKKSRRLAASFLPTGFTKPKLGTPGLLATPTGGI